MCDGSIPLIVLDGAAGSNMNKELTFRRVHSSARAFALPVQRNLEVVHNGGQVDNVRSKLVHVERRIGSVHGSAASARIIMDALSSEDGRIHFGG